jgi:hypothetical protein
MRKAEIRRLLRKSKLTGREAALLMISNLWEAEIADNDGLLSESERAAIKAGLKTDKQREEYNQWIALFEDAGYCEIDAAGTARAAAGASYSIIPEIMSYATERKLRGFRAHMPQIVTAREYEEYRLAQREDKLLQPTNLARVLNWYTTDEQFASPEVISEWAKFRASPITSHEMYHEGLFDYIAQEKDSRELARPWLEWLLRLLESGRLQQVRYSPEMAEKAESYLPASADYASIYKQESERPGARDTAALIETIQSYLQGELGAEELQDTLGEWHVAGSELYAAAQDEPALAPYQQFIERYSPGWAINEQEAPVLAILQNEDESRQWIDSESGRYRRDREGLDRLSYYSQFLRNAGSAEQLEARLLTLRDEVEQRLREMLGFERAVQAASSLLGISMDERLATTTALARDAVAYLNMWIKTAKIESPIISQEPELPLEPTDIDALEPDESVVALIEEKMGELLPAGWAQRPQEQPPEPDELEGEPA